MAISIEKGNTSDSERHEEVLRSVQPSVLTVPTDAAIDLASAGPTTLFPTTAVMDASKRARRVRVGACWSATVDVWLLRSIPVGLGHRRLLAHVLHVVHRNVFWQSTGSLGFRTALTANRISSIT